MDEINEGFSDNGRPAAVGVTAAIVARNDDPEGLFRVKLSLPWLDPGNETGWARVMAPFDADAVLPEVGDEVLVAFDQGDARFPYVLGRLPSRR